MFLISDDVWTLIGAQKRFMELGRTGQSKTANFNEKSEFPLDFSHERGAFFQNTENRNAQDNGFVQGVLSQTGAQNKGYQPNSFLSGNFNQYITDTRPSYSNVPFFQGGFSQGVSAGESYPQSSYMQGLDTGISNLSSNVIQQGPNTTNTNASSAHPSPNDKSQPFTQSEAELIKEMLSSSQIQDVFKDSTTVSLKDRVKPKEEKETADKKKEEAAKRKRERRPETWQRNIKKKLKTEGKAYVNARGKLVPEKKLMPVDCSKCKQKCSEKISEETRQKIFDWFWKLGSYTAQKEFVVSRVTQVQTKTSKRRHVHRLFSFEINGDYVSVCKPFFSKTLGIGDSYIYKAFEQKARDLFVQDGRGKHAPVNKTTEAQIDHVHNHLECHLSGFSNNRPLPKGIHAVKWYDEYIRMCHDTDQKPVSKHIYRKIFQEYTLKFPKSPEKKNTCEKGSANPSESADQQSESKQILVS